MSRDAGLTPSTRLLAIVGLAFSSGPAADAASFLRGDANADAAFNLTDPVAVLNHLFLGAGALACLDAADADDDGSLLLTDAVYALDHLFRGGPAPAAPFTGCGTDPTADGLDCAAFAPCPEAAACEARSADFHEGWERARLGQVVPGGMSFIAADEGRWFVGDTVSEFPECGPTPQRAEVIQSGAGKALRLTSENTDSECSDNVWVVLAEFPGGINRGFSVPLEPDSVISFEESGELIDPEPGRGDNCIVPPCGDAVSILLTDSNGNILGYVLQRAPGEQPNDLHEVYREIFLDPDAGSHRRNLFDDFSTIPNFTPAGAAIRSIELKVQEHGWAVLDNLGICRPGT